MSTVPRFSIAALLLACSVLAGSSALADSIRLVNGDTIVGKVVSLDENQLVLDSENFGQMKIPRQKVAIIGLGDTPLTQGLASGASAPPAAPGAPAAPGELPSMQNPQVRQQLDFLLQQALGGGDGDMRQQMQATRKGLQELQKDLGPGASADALDGYIKMFELFGGGAAPNPSQPEDVPPLQSQDN